MARTPRPKCSIEGCDRPQSAKLKCKPHYEKERLSNKKKNNEYRVCNAPGCNKQIVGTTVCAACRNIFKRTGSYERTYKKPVRKSYEGRPAEPPKCSVPSCTNRVRYFTKTKKVSTGLGSRYCSTHLTRWYKYNSFLEEVPIRNSLSNFSSSRVCTLCGETKPLNKFNRSDKSPLGVLPYCKACHSYKAKLREIKKQGILTDPTLTKRYLVDLLGMSCFYCKTEMHKTSQTGRRYDPLLVTVDHVIPISKGGTHTVENVVLCCWKCNIRKSDLDQEEFMDKIENKND